MSTPTDPDALVTYIRQLKQRGAQTTEVQKELQARQKRLSNALKGIEKALKELKKG